MSVARFPQRHLPREPREFLLRTSRNDDGTICITLNGQPAGDVEIAQIGAALIEHVRAKLSTLVADE